MIQPRNETLTRDLSWNARGVITIDHQIWFPTKLLPLFVLVWFSREKNWIYSEAQDIA